MNNVNTTITKTITSLHITINEQTLYTCIKKTLNTSCQSVCFLSFEFSFVVVRFFSFLSFHQTIRIQNHKLKTKPKRPYAWWVCSFVLRNAYMYRRPSTSEYARICIVFEWCIQRFCKYICVCICVQMKKCECFEMSLRTLFRDPYKGIHTTPHRHVRHSCMSVKHGSPKAFAVKHIRRSHLRCKSNVFLRRY